MLARLSPAIPNGPEWRYEPKWDGFRALIYRDRDDVEIGSRNALPLGRYFPEVVEIARSLLPRRCVVDGEIVIPSENGLDFEALQLRLHPAASRVQKLATELPASYVAFDVLHDGTADRRSDPFDDRRSTLTSLIESSERCFATPQTRDPREAAAWFERFEGAGLDGIVAKRGDGPYVHGERVMTKIKHERTADCIVAGYRPAKNGVGIGSLLLGLYDDDGLLHHVGFTSAFRAPQRRALLEMLKPYEQGGGFTGRAPYAASRWSQGRDDTYVALRPELVCEVAFDHLQGDRFRHGTRFIRWRPDRDARSCTYEQFEAPAAFSLGDIIRLSERSSRA